MITNDTEELDIKIYSHYDIHVPGLYRHSIKHNGLFVFLNDKPIIIMPFLYFRDNIKNIFTRFIEGDNILLEKIQCIKNQNMLLIDLVINLFVNDVDRTKFINASVNSNNYFELIDYLHEKQVFVDNSIPQAKKTDISNCINKLISHFTKLCSISYIDCYIIECTYNANELKCNYNNNYGLILVKNKVVGINAKRTIKWYKSLSDFIKTKQNDMKYEIIKSDNELFLIEEFDSKPISINIDNDEDEYVDANEYTDKDIIISQQAEEINNLKKEIELLKFKI